MSKSFKLGGHAGRRPPKSAKQKGRPCHQKAGGGVCRKPKGQTY